MSELESQRAMNGMRKFGYQQPTMSSSQAAVLRFAEGHSRGPQGLYRKPVQTLGNATSQMNYSYSIDGPHDNIKILPHPVTSSQHQNLLKRKASQLPLSANSTAQKRHQKHTWNELPLSNDSSHVNESRGRLRQSFNTTTHVSRDLSRTRPQARFQIPQSSHAAQHQTKAAFSTDMDVIEIPGIAQHQARSNIFRHEREHREHVQFGTVRASSQRRNPESHYSYNDSLRSKGSSRYNPVVLDDNNDIEEIYRRQHRVPNDAAQQFPSHSLPDKQPRMPPPARSRSVSRTNKRPVSFRKNPVTGDEDNCTSNEFEGHQVRTAEHKPQKCYAIHNGQRSQEQANNISRERRQSEINHDRARSLRQKSGTIGEHAAQHLEEEEESSSSTLCDELRVGTTSNMTRDRRTSDDPRLGLRKFPFPPTKPRHNCKSQEASFHIGSGQTASRRRSFSQSHVLHEPAVAGSSETQSDSTDPKEVQSDDVATQSRQGQQQGDTQLSDEDSLFIREDEKPPRPRMNSQPGLRPLSKMKSQKAPYEKVAQDCIGSKQEALNSFLAKMKAKQINLSSKTATAAHPNYPEQHQSLSVPLSEDYGNTFSSTKDDVNIPQKTIEPPFGTQKPRKEAAESRSVQREKRKLLFDNEQGDTTALTTPPITNIFGIESRRLQQPVFTKPGLFDSLVEEKPSTTRRNYAEVDATSDLTGSDERIAIDLTKPPATAREKTVDGNRERQQQSPPKSVVVESGKEAEKDSILAKIRETKAILLEEGLTETARKSSDMSLTASCGSSNSVPAILHQGQRAEVSAEDAMLSPAQAQRLAESEADFDPTKLPEQSNNKRLEISALSNKDDLATKPSQKVGSREVITSPCDTARKSYIVSHRDLPGSALKVEEPKTHSHQQRSEKTSVMNEEDAFRLLTKATSGGASTSTSTRKAMQSAKQSNHREKPAWNGFLSPSSKTTQVKPRHESNKHNAAIPAENMTEADLILIAMREARPDMSWKQIQSLFEERTGKSYTDHRSVAKRYRLLMKTVKPDLQKAQKSKMQVREQNSQAGIDDQNESHILISDDDSSIYGRTTAPKDSLRGLSAEELLAKARESLTAVEREKLLADRPTTGGKSISPEAMKSYLGRLSKDNEDGETESVISDDNDRGEYRLRAASPFMDQDKCHFAYYVKRKAIRTGQDEHEVDWVVVPGVFIDLTEASRAANQEIGLVRGDADMWPILGTSWRIENDMMVKWHSDLEGGVLKVEVDRFLRTFQDGQMPASKLGWVKKKVFSIVMKIMEMEYTEEEQSEITLKSEMVALKLEGEPDINDGAIFQDLSIINGVANTDAEEQRDTNELFDFDLEHLFTELAEEQTEPITAQKQTESTTAPALENMEDAIVSESVAVKTEHIPPLPPSNKIRTTRLLTVENIGSVYTYRDQANRVAAKRFLQEKKIMTPGSQRPTIDNALRERKEKEEMDQRLDELEEADESFSERFEVDAKLLEVYVEERRLEGPRNV